MKRNNSLMNILRGGRVKVTRAWEYWLAAFTVALPTLATGYALWQFISAPKDHTLDLILMISLSVLTGIGVSVGFHRLLTHKSFQCVTWLKIILTLLASMAMQGPVYFWVTYHRKHHRFSDQQEDVHSPQTLQGWRGFFHAHIGWLFNHELANRRQYAADLLQDRDLRWLDHHYFWWVLLGLLIPGVIEYGVYHTAHAFMQGIIWGGFTRIFILHHLTWSVNSFGHCIGRRDYLTDDESRNVLWLSFIGQGEGWQNNHHAFPRSARLGLAWWQWDGYYYLIQLFARLHWAWDIITPTPEELAAKRIKNSSP